MKKLSFILLLLFLACTQIQPAYQQEEIKSIQGSMVDSITWATWSRTIIAKPDSLKELYDKTQKLEQEIKHLKQLLGFYTFKCDTLIWRNYCYDIVINEGKERYYETHCVWDSTIRCDTIWR